MFQVFMDFEQTAVRLSPIVLIGPGLASVIVGLFVWLGGLGFRKVLAAILGAVIGGICGFFLIGRSIIAAAVLAIVAALAATVLHKVIITIMAVSLAVVSGFAVGQIVRPYIGVPQQSVPKYQGRVPAVGPTLSVAESVHLIKGYIIDVGDEIEQICSQMPAVGWAIIVVLVVIAVAARFYLWHLTSALCCAVLGTVLIFLGMILLLVYKGSIPVTAIYQNCSLYAAVFGAMVAFGTIEQLLLCPWLENKRKRRKDLKTDEPVKRKQIWRTS